MPATTSVIHRRLRRRNGVVAALRVAVPALGALVLVALAAQIYRASFTGRFEVGQVTVTPEAVSIDAPEYVGLLEDGSAYRVWAESARAALSSSDHIDLFEAAVTLDRADGVRLQAEAAAAQLDTSAQLTLVPGLADVADSEGTIGTLYDSIFDWHEQVLTTRGKVAIDYGDGSTIRSDGLVYDAARIVWTFTNPVVTLPSTPGEAPPATNGDDTP
ncbi:MAG: hypothetical protein ABS75_17095 [Pelagibacterium sp. SCN 63-23]|nr:MAG: hypothetical protein ABS75_17095 [Pelagibacterium sp. SCN 63-23]